MQFCLNMILRIFFLLKRAEEIIAKLPGKGFFTGTGYGLGTGTFTGTATLTGTENVSHTLELSENKQLNFVENI